MKLKSKLFVACQRPLIWKVSGVSAAWAQCMARFLPNLAETLEPMRALTRKNTPFVWSKECETVFNSLKKGLKEVVIDVPDKCLEEIRDATLRDTSLQTVVQLVLQGWPQNKHNTPSCALPYFDVRDSLGVIHGILVKGEAVVIPSELRASIKKRVHSANLGYKSMLR